MIKQYLNQDRGWPTIIIAAFCVSLIAFGGCSTKRVDIANSTIVVQCQRNTIWQISQVELKDRGFSLDRVDLRNGVIDTFPIVSKQWFEFWRKDVVGAKALAESSLHTIQRYAKMQLTEQENNKFALHCEVVVERLSSASAITSGTSRQQDVLSAGRRQKKKSSKDQWIPLGKDEPLANDILAAIKRQVSVEQENKDNE